jgi:hypothetical protein
MISMAATAAPLARIEPPDQPLSVFPLLRTVIDNPIKAWPRAVYRDRLYRRRVFGQDAVYVMAPDLIRTVLLDDADSFEKGESRGVRSGRGLAIQYWLQTDRGGDGNVAPLPPFSVQSGSANSCLR